MQRTASLLPTILFTAITFNAMAQSEFLGLPGSAYIDSLGYSQSIRNGTRDNPMGERAKDGRFWTTRNLNATYSFSQQEDGDTTDTLQSFVAELYQESDSGWILNIGGLYSQDSFDRGGFFDIEIDQDYYGVSVQPAYDFFTLWNATNRPECMKQSRLIVGVGGNYVRGEGKYKYEAPFFSSKFEIETKYYVLTPNVVFIQPITESLTTYLIPAYRMSWSDTKIKNTSSETEFDRGLFTLTARGDIQVCQRFSVVGYATWKHDVYMDPSSIKQDWAEFGGQLRFALNNYFAVQVGYSCDAFNDFYRGNNCFARIQAGF